MGNSLKVVGSSVDQAIGQTTAGILIEICGYQVLLDAEDVEKVLKQSWSVFKRDKNIYLQTRIYVHGQKRSINLARFLVWAEKGKLALHKAEAEPWDYRKSSIEVVNMQTRQTKLGKRTADASSRYKGVHWDLKRGVWCAGIRPSGRSIFLGAFDTEEKAARAYDQAARLHFGNDAYQNFPEDDDQQEASA